MKFGLTIVIACIIFLSCKNSLKTPVTDFEHMDDSTTLIFQWGSSSHQVNSVNAYVWKDQLSLILDDPSRSIDGVDVEVQNEGGRWAIASIIQYRAPLDCLYVVSQYRILDQSIKLDKSQYKPEDKIKGLIELRMLGRKSMFREPEVPFMDTRQWDSIYIKGRFSTRIQ